MDLQYRWTSYGGTDVPVPIPAYKYTPCDATRREFRLLEITPPSSPADQTTLRCKLHHHSLDDSPTFIALSYECGDPSQYECIRVDDEVFPVSLNLHQALLQLRSRRCPLVWVDAICIHQTDAAEKSEHILMMKDIYHSASRVAVWLGKTDFGSEKVMAMLNAIDQSRDPDRSNGRPPWTPNWGQLQDLKPEMVAFLQDRTYWQRAWIVQEIALGSEVVLFCGAQSVRWRGLEVLVQLVTELHAFPEIDLHHVLHLCKMRSSRVTGVPIGLLTALCGGSRFRASVFHDCVYASLGLAFDQAAFVPRVDYTWSSTTVCLELTKSWILSRKSLDIIIAGGANSSTRGESVSSWIPNYLAFRDSHVLQKLSLYISGQDKRYRAGRMCQKWTASGSTVFNQQDLKITDGHLLRVKGICIGTINGLGAILGDDRKPVNGPALAWKNDRPEEALEETICGSLALYEQDYEDVMDQQKLLEFIFKFDSMMYGFMKSRELKARFINIAEWREKNADFEVRGKKLSLWNAETDIEDRTLNTALFAARFTALTVINQGFSSAKKPVKLKPKRPPPKHHDLDMVAVLQNFSDLLDEGLRLMVTDFGDMGWAHPAAEIGDVIALLKGCSVPVVLRRTRTVDGSGVGAVYRVVGHAYGHGVMWGEAWSTVREQELVDIILR